MDPVAPNHAPLHRGSYRFAKVSRELYRRTGFYSSTGVIDLAQTEATEAKLKEWLKLTRAHKVGNGRMVTPAEIKALHPLTDPLAGKIRAGLYYSPDGGADAPGRVQPVQAMAWLANAATAVSKGAVSFVGGVGVEKIERHGDGAVAAVTTTCGAVIEVGRVVNAAGAWSPAVHGLIDGVGTADRLPLFSIEHQWSLTAPLKGLDPLPSHSPAPPQKHEHQTWRAAVRLQLSWPWLCLLLCFPAISHSIPYIARTLPGLVVPSCSPIF